MILLVTALLVSAAVSLVVTPSLAGEPLSNVISQNDSRSAIPSDDGEATQDVELNLTVTYDLAPDSPNNVSVEIVVENPEISDTIWISESLTTRTVVSADGFTKRGSTLWYVDDGAEKPTLTYHLEVDPETRPHRDGGSWAFVHIDRIQAYFEIDGEQRSDRSFTHVPTEGIRSGDRLYLGPYETATAEAGDATITVVASTEAERAEPPQQVADALADVSAEIDVGVRDHDVTAFAVPEVPTREGAAWGTERFVTEADVSIYESGSTWFHEYVHTTDPHNVEYTLDDDMKWFTEGYAQYSAGLYALETGYNDYQQFRSYLESGVDEPSILSDSDTWEDAGNSRHENDYYQGARVLAALDREIRETTDGERTYRDVVAEVYDSEEVDLERFLDIVEDVAGTDVADAAETWLTTETVPDTWTHSEHEDVFGDVPNVSISTSISAQSTGGTYQLTTSQDTPVVVTANETVAGKVTISNDGGTTGRLSGPFVNALSLSSAETEVLLDEEPISVEGNATTTIDFTHRFDEPGEYILKASGVNPAALSVLERGSTIVRADGSNDDPWNAAIVTDTTPVLALQPGDSDATITVEASDGDVIFETDSARSSNGVATIDPETLEPGETYEVTFGSGSEASTQYVTSVSSTNWRYSPWSGSDDTGGDLIGPR